MINSLLFGTYSLSIGAIIYNIAKTKLQDDFENEIRQYREYDYNNEKLKKEQFQSGKESKCIILAKYKDPYLHQENQNIEDQKKILFERDIAIFNILDPSKLFSTKIKSNEQFSMVFDNNDYQEGNLEIKFQKGQKIQFFDLETIQQDHNAQNAKNTIDYIKKVYYQQVWKRDFSYVKKGITVDKKTGEGPELLFIGSVNYDKNQNRFIMVKPKLIIGSDRLELYEFLARRREVINGFNKNWLKLAFAVTLIHAVIVQVPTLFSKFFGDEVSNLEKKLGSQDQSEIGLKMSRYKENQKRKEL